MNRRPPLSEYRAVWLFAMFDLPVVEKKQRRAYTLFRKELLRLGFTMLQYSVYARYYQSEEASHPQRKHIEGLIPPGGRVRLMTVTDRQFAKMDVFYGKTKRPTERAPRQLELF